MSNCSSTWIFTQLKVLRARQLLSFSYTAFQLRNTAVLRERIDDECYYAGSQLAYYTMHLMLNFTRVITQIPKFSRRIGIFELLL